MSYSPEHSHAAFLPCRPAHLPGIVFPPQLRIRRLLAGMLLLVPLLSLTACAHPDGREMEKTLAAAGGFRSVRLATETFILHGQLRPGETDILRVYIEGDGRAWLSRTRPSADPTPGNPVALRLAASDPSLDSVLYLARPCQYVSGGDRRNCAPRWWTSARLAPEVIDSINAAVDQAKARTRATRVALFGYSGGGGAAVLAAARRRDVIFMATVAGNLHSAAWTRHHGVSPLSASLDPFDCTAAVAGIPQQHISGDRDDIVPPVISQGFCAAVGAAAQCRTLPGMTHGGAWEHVWRAPLTLP